MWCACRSDAGLYYKISEDLKIYPEHNGYTHDKYCCRYKDITGTGAQKLPYIVGENGDVTVCTSFDPGRYPGSADNLEQKRRYAVDSNAESTESEEILIDRDNSGKRINEPQLGLDRLIRCINVDCFTEKVLNNKTIENRLNFSTYVYHRTKRIRLSRNKRVIGDLNLEKDGVRFIYTPFAGINQIKDQNFSRCYIQTLGIDEKIFKNFTFPEIAERR